MDRTLETILEEFRGGKTSPIDIFQKLSQNIERTDSSIRSYLALNRDAGNEARKAAEALKRGNAPFLAGMPVSVKDLVDTKGIATTYGNSHYSSNVPEKDARVITEIKKSGGYVLGKTNTHEFALGMESSPTANPWDTDRIPGGSSGGSAAAVAAGSAIFAIGSDTGGSIRIPASMCGVTGLKPTYGSISAEGVFPESWTLDHLGPITKFASDIPLMMKAMGCDMGNARLGRKVKAGVVIDYMEEAHPGVRKTLEEAISVLEENGLISTFDFPADILEQANAYHEIIDTSEIAAIHKHRYREHPEIFLPTSIEQIEAGMSRTGPEYVEAARERDPLYSRYEKAMGDADFVILPTMAKTAPLKSEMRAMTLEEHSPYVKYLAFVNYLGNPAISIPCGFSNGLPVGIQIMGKRNHDAEVVALAAEYQKLTHWHLMHPEAH